jgi:hypothetical protein
MDISRLLPKDQYDAAIGAASPTLVNPFATIADLPTPTGDGIYTGNGLVPNNTVASLANVFSIGTSLFKLTDSTNRVDLATLGGITRMGTANNYLEQNTQITTQFSSTASYTGFHANRNGNGIRMVSGSTNRSHIESTGSMFFHTGWGNNPTTSPTAAPVMVIGVSKGVGIGLGYGGANENPVESLKVRGKGNTTATTLMRLESVSAVTRLVVLDNGDTAIGYTTPSANTKFSVRSSDDIITDFQNSTGGSVMKTRDSGLVQIGTNATASVYNLVSERSTSDNTIHQHARFLHRFTPTVNGTGRTTTLNTTAYKQGNFNSFYNVGIYATARAWSGNGNVTNQYAGEFANTQNSTGTISRNFSINSLMTATSGTVTHHGGLQIQTNALNGTAVVTNMYGIWLNAPSNTGGTVGTTYGIKLEANDLGTNNWGIYQNSTVANNYFGGITSIGSSSISGTAKLQVTGDIEVFGVNNGIILEDSLGSGNRCIVYVKELTPGLFTLHTNPLP